MTRLVLAMLVLVGCSDPTFTLRFRVTSGPADVCTNAAGAPVTQCQDVTMPCAAVASIRVFNPNTPTSPFISVCQELMMAPKPTLCEIAQVNLPQPAMPVDAQTLEVEILVYPKNRLAVDQNLVPICPSMVNIGIDGFPTPSLAQCMPDEPCEPTPAVGGIAFYHPGDPETVVELGCADLSSLRDQVCTGPSTEITATVTDFDTLVSVPQSLAQHLTVSLGQPKIDDTFGLVADLEPTTDTTPKWQSFVSDEPAIPCIQVDEDVAARTDSVRCTAPVGNDPPARDLVGTRLAKATLDDIIAALGLTGFPDDGLVVGIVLDDQGNPAGGLQVTSTNGTGDPGTIEYLSSDRHSTAGTVTSTNGIFVSQDAPFGTTFSTMQSGRAAQAVGGRIVGKVTIVVLQIPQQTGA
jgi:hypothetical protein